MKFILNKALCTLMAFLLSIQPAILAAHDFGGSSQAGGIPGSDLDQDIKKNQTTGGEVSLLDGSETFSEVDLRVRGYFPISFKRTYDSRSTYDSPLGYGWNHNFNVSLFTYNDGSAVIRWGNGAKLRYVETGGSFVSADNAPGTLTSNIDGSFSFLTPKGMEYLFDIRGNLVKIIDNHGNYLQLSYSADKKPLTGRSPFSVTPDLSQVVSYSYQLLTIAEGISSGLTGRSINLSYDAGTGRLTGITDSGGRSVSYGHDNIGNLTRITYPENLLHLYGYNDPNDSHNITSFMQGHVENGADVLRTLYQNVYDTEDRVITQNRAGGTINIEYTIPLAKTTVTRIIRSNTGTELHNFKNIYEYNSDGFLVKFSDEEGNLLEQIYDASNNMTKKVVWENKGTVDSPSLVVFETTYYQYDSSSNLQNRKIVLDDGETLSWSFTYDHGWTASTTLTSSRFPGKKRQMLQEFYYNNDGIPKSLKKERVLLSESPVQEYLDVEYSYNDYGQLSNITYSNGDQKEYTFANGVLVGMNGYEYVRSTDGRDNISEIRGPQGTILQYQYDGFDRPIQVTNNIGEKAVFNYTGWQLTSAERGKTATQAGYLLQMVYDDVGRVVSKSINLNSGSYAATKYTYDSSGNVLAVSNNGNNSLTYTYDSKGRKTKVTYPSNSYLVYEYDILGNLVKQSSPVEGTSTQYIYDKFNRILRTTDALGNSVSYDYEFSNVRAITDSRGNIRTFGYDLAGRLISEISSGQSETSYGFDDKGRLAHKIDGNGVRTDFSYSSTNNVQEITIAVNPQKTLSYGYDTIGNLTSYTDSSIAATPVLSYTYDNLQRIDTVTNEIIGKTIDYDYNRFGSIASLTVREIGGTDLFSFTYNYDDSGRLLNMSEDGSRQTTLEYDGNGRVVKILYPQGTSNTIIYDANGYLSELDYKKADETTLASFQYQYNGVGIPTTVTDSSGTSSFTYDALFQLTGATYPTGSPLNDESYTYDSTGNRLTSTDFSDYTYNDADQLTHFGSTNVDYDNNGNILSSTTGGITTSYTYDAINRLTGISKAGVNATYHYDHASRRIKKQINGIDQWFMYDGYQVIAEFDGAGNLQRHYGYLPGSSAVHSVKDNTGYYSVLSDRLGVPRKMVSEAEQIVWQGDYQAFGKMQVNDDVDNNGITTALNLRHSGQYFDEESDLHANSYRFYNPDIGRYLSIDPLQDDIYRSNSLNGYIYGYNNPVSFFDPDGRKSVWGYFWEEITTRPFQNTWDGMRGKMGGWTQAISVGAAAVAAVALTVAAGAWIVGGGAAAAVESAATAVVSGVEWAATGVMNGAVTVLEGTASLASSAFGLMESGATYVMTSAISAFETAGTAVMSAGVSGLEAFGGAMGSALTSTEVFVNTLFTLGPYWTANLYYAEAMALASLLGLIPSYMVTGAGPACVPDMDTFAGKIEAVKNAVTIPYDGGKAFGEWLRPKYRAWQLGPRARAMTPYVAPPPQDLKTLFETHNDLDYYLI